MIQVRLNITTWVSDEGKDGRILADLGFENFDIMNDKYIFITEEIFDIQEYMKQFSENTYIV